MPIAEVLKTYEIRLDIKKSVTYEEFELVEGDNANVLGIYVHDSGTPIDLTGCRIMATFSHSGTTVQQDSGVAESGITIGGDDDNVVSIRLKSGSYAPNGITVCELKIWSGDTLETIATTPYLTFTSHNTLSNDAAVEAQEAYPALVQLIQDYNAVLAREQSNYTETDITKPTYIRNKPVVGTDVQAAIGTLETAIPATADTVAFLDATDGTHKKTLFSVLFTKIFGSITGMVKADGAGNISAAAANTDFAAATHASRHASGAADAVTPAAIGAETNTIVVNEQTEDYTVALTDDRAEIIITNASARTLTIDTNANKAYPAGFMFFLTRGGAGSLTIAGAGTTLHSAGNRLKVAEQHATVCIRRTAQDVWQIVGNTAV